MSKGRNSDIQKEFFDAYSSAATNLRTWLVAYGIGAPVLFLSNEALWQALSKAKCAECVAILFLTGVFFQVLIAIINKNAMWFCYFGEYKTSFKNKYTYRLCYWISEQFWIDIAFDLASIACFITATYRVFKVVVN